jgi:hypothetical protein
MNPNDTGNADDQTTPQVVLPIPSTEPTPTPEPIPTPVVSAPDPSSALVEETSEEVPAQNNEQ